MFKKTRPIDRYFGLGLSLIVLIILVTLLVFNQRFQSIRSPMVAYIGNPLTEPEVWVVEVDGTQSRQVTSTGGKVHEFSTSPDGEYVTYSVINNEGGMDLYLIDREGQSVHQLAACGGQKCSQSTWASDGNNIAYSQYASDYDTNAEIKVVSNPKDKSGSEAFDKHFYGKYPSFSPDSRFLAYYNFAEQGFTVADLETGHLQFVPSDNPDTASWSPDSSQIYFTVRVDNGLVPQAQLMEYSLINHQIETYLPTEMAGYDASRIEWSANGEWATIGLKSSESQSGRQIYLLRMDGQDFHAITDEAGTSHSAYHWNPQGLELVFQRYAIGVTNSQPEIVLWSASTNEMKVLAENGALPAWLP